MATAVVAGRRDRSRPASRALLPQWGARLFGLAALSTVGALQWQRLVEGLSTTRVLLWVLAAVGSALAVLAVTAPPRRRWRLGVRLRAFSLVVVVGAALLAGYLLAGLELWYLRPRHWDELLAGLGGGLQALGTVRLPYASADPWPRIVLELLGVQLLILAGLLTFWPRVAMRADERVPLKVPERGYPFVALAVLIVVVASPIVSIGGTRPVLLGLTIAALAVCFLWLERLPLKPGLGVLGLLVVALVGALPVAATADRGEPWFDYRSFAESLGPEDPVRFSWTQSYGPINWPRDGNEVMRVVSGEPLYWKARNLDTFNGNAWQIREDIQDTRFTEEPWESDVPEDWADRPDVDERDRGLRQARPDHGRDRRGHDHRDRREFFARASRLLPRHVGRAGRAAPQRLLLRARALSESVGRGHRGGDAGRGRAPGRDADVDGPVPGGAGHPASAGRVRQHAARRRGARVLRAVRQHGAVERRPTRGAAVRSSGRSTRSWSARSTSARGSS